MIVGSFEIDGFVALAVATFVVAIVNIALDVTEGILFGRHEDVPGAAKTPS